MSDPTQFLQAIRKDYFNDAPRLVYADRLEENGQSERAEHIRLDIQLENDELTRMDRDRIDQRLTDLVNQHGEEWLKPIPKNIREHRLVSFLSQGAFFSRGMVSITVGPRSFLAKKLQEKDPSWLQKGHVVELEFSGGKQCGKALCSPLVEGVPSLKSYDCPVTDEEIEEFAKLPHINNVQHLWLGQTKIGTKGLRAIAHSPNLGKLISFALLADPSARDIVPLIDSPLWSRLERLQLSNTGLLSKFDKLVAALEKPKLILLDLSMTRLEDEHIGKLMQSKGLSTLERLDLGSGQFGSAGARAIAQCSALPGLKELDIHWNKIGDEGAKALAESPHLKHLRSLNVERCALSPEGAEMLREAFGDRVKIKEDWEEEK